MRVTFITKMGIALTLHEVVNMILPGIGVITPALVWLLVGEWWNLVFVYQWLVTFARIPWLIPWARELMEAMIRGMIWLETFLGIDPNYQILQRPIINMVLTNDLILLTSLIVMSYVSQRLIVWKAGKFLERKTASFLGYMPRSL